MGRMGAGNGQEMGRKGQERAPWAVAYGGVAGSRERPSSSSLRIILVIFNSFGRRFYVRPEMSPCWINPAHPVKT